MIIKANSLHIPLKDESVHCVVTSPPYFGLRRYEIPDSIWDGFLDCEHQWGDKERGGLLHENRNFKRGSNEEVANREPLVQVGDERRDGGGRFCVLCHAWRGQLGLEPNIGLYVQHLIQIFREVKRVLRNDGTLWLNLADSYASGKGSCYNPGGGERSFGKYLKAAGVHNLNRSNISELKEDGLKPKDLCMIPARVALALQADSWWLRSMIPWVKRNSMPSSCDDRPTVAIEYIFLLTKSHSYFYDTNAVRMPAGRIKACGKNSRMNIDRDPAHLPSYRSGNKTRRIADGSHGRVNDHLGSGVPRKDNGAGRYRRNSDWFFESLRGMLTDDEGDPLALIVNPQSYKGAHFSTFSEALVEPMIKAGSSERGCCRKCGSPWQRKIEKTFMLQQDVSLERGIKGAPGQKPMDASSGWDGVPRGSNLVKTLGWQPTCLCDSGDPMPCVILDPFSGTGTTLKVAKQLGRIAVGLDLGYHELARIRTSNNQIVLPMGV